MRVHPDRVATITRPGTVRTRPAGEQLTLDCENADKRIQLSDIDGVIGIYEYVAGPGQVRPLSQILSIGCEYLNAAVLPVCDEDSSIGVDPNAVGNLELPRCGLARFAP